MQEPPGLLLGSQGVQPPCWAPPRLTNSICQGGLPDLLQSLSQSYFSVGSTIFLLTQGVLETWPGGTALNLLFPTVCHIDKHWILGCKAVVEYVGRSSLSLLLSLELPCEQHHFVSLTLQMWHAKGTASSASFSSAAAYRMADSRVCSTTASACVCTKPQEIDYVEHVPTSVVGAARCPCLSHNAIHLAMHLHWEEERL